MTSIPISMPMQRTNLTLPILVGGATAGTFDLIAAYLTFGANMPRGIAAGLIGGPASRVGAMPYVLGIFLHYFIAFSAAAIYCLSSRKLPFLKDHFIVCGMFLRNRRLSRDESRRPATLRIPLHGTVSVSRPDAGPAHAYAHHRTPDLVQPEQAVRLARDDSKNRKPSLPLHRGWPIPAQSPAPRDPAPAPRHASPAASPAPRHRARETPPRPEPATHPLLDRP